MQNKLTESKTFWLIAGTILGMTISYYSPTERAYADSADSSEKFAMCTVPSLIGQSETIFVLDQVTGRLLGAGHNAVNNAFSQTFARNLAADFKVVDNAEYVMVPGRVELRNTGGSPAAEGAIYVGELNSGIVNMYGYSYVAGNRNVPTRELVLINSFPWRGSIK